MISLKDKFPELLKEWDYTLNDIEPNHIAFSSTKKVYWKCPKNHSYQTIIKARSMIRTDCPYCSGQKVLKGFNDLLSNFPDIAKEWDYELNDIRPDEITSKSAKKVYWKCSKGHSFQSIIYNRTGKDKSGCYYCSGHKVLKGYNDLLTLFPDLCKEWDYEKNNKLNIFPDEVTSGSNKKVYWIKNGKSSRCSINTRRTRFKSSQN